MTKTIARNADNDIYLDFTGQIAMANGIQALEQIAKAAILTVKGELQYNTEGGIPYFETVFKSQNNIYLWRAYVLRRIRQFAWVKDITSFEYSVDNTEHTINYSITIVTNDERSVSVNGAA